jgi:hypothetical protein
VGKFSQFLQEGNGKLSATRLAFLIWAVGGFGLFALVSIKSGTFAPIPDNYVWVAGVFMTGRFVQRFGEK